MDIQNNVQLNTHGGVNFSIGMSNIGDIQLKFKTQKEFDKMLAAIGECYYSANNSSGVEYLEGSKFPIIDRENLSFTIPTSVSDNDKARNMLSCYFPNDDVGKAFNKLLSQSAKSFGAKGLYISSASRFNSNHQNIRADFIGRDLHVSDEQIKELSESIKQNNDFTPQHKNHDKEADSILDELTQMKEQIPIGGTISALSRAVNDSTTLYVTRTDENTLYIKRVTIYLRSERGDERSNAKEINATVVKFKSDGGVVVSNEAMADASRFTAAGEFDSITSIPKSESGAKPLIYMGLETDITTYKAAVHQLNHLKGKISECLKSYDKDKTPAVNLMDDSDIKFIKNYDSESSKQHREELFNPPVMNVNLSDNKDFLNIKFSSEADYNKVYGAINPNLLSFCKFSQESGTIQVPIDISQDKKISVSTGNKDSAIALARLLSDMKWDAKGEKRNNDVKVILSGGSNFKKLLYGGSIEVVSNEHIKKAEGYISLKLKIMENEIIQTLKDSLDVTSQATQKIKELNELGYSSPIPEVNKHRISSVLENVEAVSKSIDKVDKVIEAAQNPDSKLKDNKKEDVINSSASKLNASVKDEAIPNQKGNNLKNIEKKVYDIHSSVDKLNSLANNETIFNQTENKFIKMKIMLIEKLLENIKALIDEITKTLNKASHKESHDHKIGSGRRQ